MGRWIRRMFDDHYLGFCIVTWTMVLLLAPVILMLMAKWYDWMARLTK